MKIKLSKSQWEKIGKTAGWMKTANQMRFQYVVDHDERDGRGGGLFGAHLEDEAGTTVWSSKSDETGAFPPVADGYMQDRGDLDGLCDWLIKTGVLPQDAQISWSRSVEPLHPSREVTPHMRE